MVESEITLYACLLARFVCLCVCSWRALGLTELAICSHAEHDSYFVREICREQDQQNVYFFPVCLFIYLVVEAR